ncbi:MAG: tetratricopeptide repeat protein [Desulfobacterales bacterium]|nr:tetratricopeptide repeat protein [Desulfobacterales bacterium]
MVLVLDPANVLAWNRLGHILIWEGAAQRAIDAYGQAFDLQDYSQESRALRYGHLGNVWQQLGYLDAALALYSQSIAISEARNDQVELGLVYGNMGLALQKHGDLDQGLEMYVRSLAFHESMGMVRKVGKLKFWISSDCKGVF